MQIITPTEARKNLFSLIDEVYEKGEVLIKGKNHNAILVSEQDWSGMQETLYLYSVPGMVESIKKAAAEPIEDGVSYEDALVMLDEDSE